MPIRFPHINDITLEAPPITEVICQIRFAPILKIGEGLPSEFQHLLRANFPKFSQRNVLRIEITGGGTPPGIPLPNEFEFKSADEQISIALGVDFVALSTQRYRHWAAFAESLATILRAFEKVYGSILATRIGLRYINTLNYENTLTRTPDELVNFLNPELTHFFRNSIWSPPEKVANLIVMKDDNESLAFRIGMDATSELHIILDYDYYSEIGNPMEITSDYLLDTVRRYHERIYNAFRWSIPDHSVQAFRPIHKEGE